MKLQLRPSGLMPAALVAAAAFWLGIGPQYPALARSHGVSTATPIPGATDASGRPIATPGPKASATDAPTPAPYSTLDGVWEVQLQTGAKTSYSHFKLKQAGQDVSGTWLVDGKQVPLTGTYDGRAFRFLMSGPAGQVSLTGYADNATEMVGLLDRGTGLVTPFTASHHSSPLESPRPDDRGWKGKSGKN